MKANERERGERQRDQLQLRERKPKKRDLKSGKTKDWYREKWLHTKTGRENVS